MMTALSSVKCLPSSKVSTTSRASVAASECVSYIKTRRIARVWSRTTPNCFIASRWGMTFKYQEHSYSSSRVRSILFNDGNWVRRSSCDFAYAENGTVASEPPIHMLTVNEVQTYVHLLPIECDMQS